MTTQLRRVDKEKDESRKSVSGTVGGDNGGLDQRSG